MHAQAPRGAGDPRPSPEGPGVPAVRRAERLAAVRQTGLLDTGAEEAFDRLAGLARTLLKTPFAFVTIVDDVRSFWKSCVGVDATELADRQNPVGESFCQYVIDRDRPLIVGDASTDPVTRTNPSIEAMGVRAWAGFPVRSIDGEALGTFCVVDTVPREWSEEEVGILAALAGAAEGEIRMRTLLARSAALAVSAQRQVQVQARLANLAEGLATAETTDAVAAVIAEAGVAVFDAVVATVGLLDDAQRQIQLRTSEAQHRQRDGADVVRMSIEAELPTASAASTGHPVLLGSRTEIERRFPDVVSRDRFDIQSLASLPLRRSDDSIIGALSIGWSRPTDIDIDDRSLLRTVSIMCAQAIERAQLGDVRREFVSSLQRELLPRTPTIGGLDVAVRYMPAATGIGFGGDWYDVIELDDGRAIVVVGDIAGHGIEAAARMTQVRGAINTLARISPDDPASILGDCERMLAHLGESYIATLVIFLVDAQRGTIGYVSAGHPPALLFGADGTVTSLDEGRRPLLGSGGGGVGAPVLPGRATMPDGATLVAFTDGLVERRDQSADAGAARLVAAVRDELKRARVGCADVDAVADRIVADLIGDRVITDDVALVVVQRRSVDQGPEPAP